jgi:phosphoglycolate phosphatase
MRLLIFDYDGVLADTLEDMLRFAQETCDELGVTHTVLPSDLRDLDVMSFTTFGRACGVPEELTGEFARRCTRKFAEKVTPPAIFDGLSDVIRRLAERNILVIVSGNTTENVKAFLFHHGLLDCFHMVYGVDMPGSKAGKIQLAQKRFGTGRKTVYFVGDSLSDLRAAREAGVKSIAVSWGHQSLEMLVGGRPDAIVHSPGELYVVLGSDG